MTSEWTLPLFGDELDHLPRGCDFILSEDDAARLFVAGAAPSDRQIAAFAFQRGCQLTRRPGELVFRKAGMAPAEPAAEPQDALDCFPPSEPHKSDGDDHPGCGSR